MQPAPAKAGDPLIGRFLSVDPVGFSVDRPFMFGRYTYVGNDPVNKWDPTGRNSEAGHMRLQAAGRSNPKEVALVGGASIVISAACVFGGCEAIVTVIGKRVLGIRAASVLRRAKKIRVRDRTRTGKSEKQIKITDKKDIDTYINPRRVKQEAPNKHPEAPAGAKNKVKQKNPQPGSKGMKRDPTPLEREILKRAKEK